MTADYLDTGLSLDLSMGYAPLHPFYASSITNESALALLVFQIIVFIVASLMPPAWNEKLISPNTSLKNAIS